MFNLIILIIGILCILISIVIVLINRNNLKKTLLNLSQMLDIAISGNFTENTYNELLLSSLETKLNKFLSKCIVSSKNIQDEKEKIKSLISDISHQTKTPISNIMLYSSILSEQQNLPEECYLSIKEICFQSEKLDFLITSLVKTSRLETGIISVKPSKSSILELINLSVQQIKEKALEKRISIDLDLKEVVAIFDMKWTIEAIVNILDNAIKYTNYDGKIIIKVLQYEFFCRIDIKDNGIGIKEKEQSKIFMRFYRSSNVQQIEGVGIGLYLSREIISYQKGYIKVNSKPNEGSIFSVFLPIEN